MKFQTKDTIHVDAAIDLAHREGIHRAMLDALKSHGIPDKYAVDVVCLLRSNAIPFVTVEY